MQKIERIQHLCPSDANTTSSPNYIQHLIQTPFYNLEPTLSPDLFYKVIDGHNTFMYFILFWGVTEIELRGTRPLSHIPSPILYFL